MARIAFAWELGASYGHAINCAALAGPLRARGHSIALMFRELHQLALVPEANEFEVFQAPRFAREGETAATPASFADILLGCGYSSERDLVPLLVAWRTLFSRWRPDLVVADFAPTALAAARILGLPRVTYGNGFFTPPRLSPLPAFRHGDPVAHERLVEADAKALETLNTSFLRLNALPVARLADQFEVDEDFLCTFPELDHYGNRPASGYWGPRFRFDRGADAQWPAGSGKRVFIYLQRWLPQLDALIESVVGSRCRIVAFIPDLEGARQARLMSAGAQVAHRPLRLDILLKHCDLVISLGGEIASGALMEGVAQLVLPLHYEQYLFARRIEQIGAGAWLGPQASGHEMRSAIEALLRDPRFADAAKAYARRYPAFNSREQRRRIVARIEEILAKRAAVLPGAGATPILTPSQGSGDGTR